jgi:putative DNA primase/helicase
MTDGRLDNEDGSEKNRVRVENEAAGGNAVPVNGSAAGGGEGEARVAKGWDGREGAGRKERGLVELPIVEPWGEPVRLAEVLETIVKEEQRFVVLPKWAAETFALWIVHTFAYRLREVATYVGIESPEKECGKSTLITLLSHFVNRPAVSSNISPSAFFRVIEDLEPTLLIDEADTNLKGKDDLMGILNSGYMKPTGFVWRVSYEPLPEGEDGEGRAGAGNGTGHVARYSSWGPKAIAAIGRLHPTLASRCIVVRMQRKTAREECERLKRVDARELKRKCARFVADNGEAIARAEPAIPAGLANRAADVWEPLLVLADLAGGQWPQVAREAALGLTATAQEHSPVGSLLLDIFVEFVEGKKERIFSRDLVAALNAAGERPWAELRKRKPLTETWLAQQLRPYGIKPRTVRIGEGLAKGYVRGEMLETFQRYIPKAEFEALMTEAAELTALAEELKATPQTGPEPGNVEAGKAGTAQEETGRAEGREEHALDEPRPGASPDPERSP